MKKIALTLILYLHGFFSISQMTVDDCIRLYNLVQQPFQEGPSIEVRSSFERKCDFSTLIEAVSDYSNEPILNVTLKLNSSELKNKVVRREGVLIICNLSVSKKEYYDSIIPFFTEKEDNGLIVLKRNRFLHLKLNDSANDVEIVFNGKLNGKLRYRYFKRPKSVQFRKRSNIFSNQYILKSFEIKNEAINKLFRRRPIKRKYFKKNQSGEFQYYENYYEVFSIC